jgi:hypothetical protein
VLRHKSLIISGLHYRRFYRLSERQRANSTLKTKHSTQLSALKTLQLYTQLVAHGGTQLTIQQAHSSKTAINSQVSLLKFSIKSEAIIST